MLASNAKEVGLLVEILREQSSIIFIGILHRIYISVKSDPKVIQRLRAEFLKPDFGSMLCGEKLPPDQHWCVDGRAESKSVKSLGKDEDVEIKNQGKELKRRETAPIPVLRKAVTGFYSIFKKSNKS